MTHISTVRSLVLRLPLITVVASCALNKDIRVTSEPEGALVFIDGRKVGATPITIETDDLMPNRAMDGRVSARSVVTMEKEGYDDYRLVLREWSLPSEIHAVLPPTSIAPSFEDYSLRVPGLMARTLSPNGEPDVVTTNDLDAESERLVGSGYVMIGYVGSSGEGVAVEEVRALARKHDAVLALVQSHYVGTQSEVRAVTSHTSGAVVSNFGSAVGSGTYVGNASATTSGGGSTYQTTGTYAGRSSAAVSASGLTIVPGTSRTEFVPFARRHFDTQVTLWRKRKPSLTGAYTDPIPPSLRGMLQRNTGALVVAVEDNSPAFLANVVPGDLIVAFAGEEVIGPEDLESAAARAAGPTRAEIIRNGTKRVVALEIVK